MITIPEDLIILPNEIHKSGICTLSSESENTLKKFIIPISFLKIEPIITKYKFRKLVENIDKINYDQIKNYPSLTNALCAYTENNKAYNNWICGCEKQGYEYIISEICCRYTPFYNIDICCYLCREGIGHGCEERKKYVYIWFWKPITEKDTWTEQEKLLV